MSIKFFFNQAERQIVKETPETYDRHQVVPYNDEDILLNMSRMASMINNNINKCKNYILNWSHLQATHEQ